MKHIFIFAGSHRQAQHIANEKGLHPQQWKYLSRAEQLRGLRGGLFIKHGTWYEKNYRHDIEQMTKEREMIEVTDVNVES